MSALKELIEICKSDDILRQWAHDAEADLAAKDAAIERLQVIERAFFEVVAPDGFMQVGIYEECPMCHKEEKHADDCELDAALKGA